MLHIENLHATVAGKLPPPIGGPERARIFDAIDADKEAGFPEATRKVRERRRAFEAQSGTPK